MYTVIFMSSVVLAFSIALTSYRAKSKAWCAVMRCIAVFMLGMAVWAGVNEVKASQTATESKGPLRLPPGARVINITDHNRVAIRYANGTVKIKDVDSDMLTHGIVEE